MAAVTPVTTPEFSPIKETPIFSPLLKYVDYFNLTCCCLSADFFPLLEFPCDSFILPRFTRMFPCRQVWYAPSGRRSSGRSTGKTSATFLLCALRPENVNTGHHIYLVLQQRTRKPSFAGSGFCDSCLPWRHWGRATGAWREWKWGRGWEKWWRQRYVKLSFHGRVF